MKKSKLINCLNKIKLYMKGKKVLVLFDELGGKATTEEMRDLAKFKYPNLTLHRTLHTTLKELLKENLVRYDGETKTWYKLYPPVTQPGLAICETEPEMEQKKEILKLSEPLNPHAIYIAKKEPNFDQDNPDMYHIDLNKEPIDPTGELGESALSYHTKWSKQHFKYRDKHEIACSVLQAIKEGKKRTTAIMYTSWLSHYQLRKYLTTLLQNELIVQTSKNTYDVTPKGTEFLDAMEKVSQIKFD